MMLEIFVQRRPRFRVPRFLPRVWGIGVLGALGSGKYEDVDYRV